MKTLDEVIKAMDNDCTRCGECPYVETRYCKQEMQNDVLHYLKEYQRYQNTPSCMCHMAMCDENNPLTWQELTQMIGKPVWDEGKTVKHWTIITGIYYDDLNEGYVLLTYYSERNGAQTIRRKRSTMGKTWNAYRKERK